MAQQLIITQEPKQELGLILENGERIVLYIKYIMNFTGWYLISFTYQAKTKYVNKRITLNPNLLTQFYNLIPFGLACLSNDDVEPTYQDDFSDNRVVLVLTEKTDTATLEEAYFNK